MLEIKNLQKQYMAGATAISHFNLNVADEEIVSILGGEGAGKTTLLKVISGVVEKSGGSVLLDGKPLVKNDVIMVFDDLALMPNWTIRKNLEFSLTLRNLSDTEKYERVREAADYLGLFPVLDEKTKSIPAFDKKKAALARLILRDDFKLVLVDNIGEGLGAQERKALWHFAMSILANLAKPVIYSTNLPEEALSVADRIVVMEMGSVRQIGTKEEILMYPQNVSAAKIINSRYNIIPADLVKSGELGIDFGGARLSIADLEQRLCSSDYIGRRVLVGFAADDVVPYDIGVTVELLYEEKTLDKAYLHCLHRGGEIQILDRFKVISDRVITFLPRADKLCLFDLETENCLLK